MVWQYVERVCVYTEMEGTLTGLRNSAMICLSRISEVITDNVADFKSAAEFTERGAIVRYKDGRHSDR